MDAVAYKLLGAGIAMVGTFGAGIGLGQLFSAWLTGIARNPAASDRMSTPGFIGFAAIELVLLLAFVVAMLLIFAV